MFKRSSKFTLYELMVNLVLLTLLMASCTPVIVQKTDPAKAPLTPLRVTALPFLSFAPLYIADAEGFFTEQGLKVEFVHFQRNGDSLPALLKGDVDVDSIFTVGLLNAI